MRITDFKSKQLVNQEKFNGEYNWMCEWATFNGDERALTPAQLRKCIGDALRSSSDLDAFCSDYFQPVYARFTDGMDRVARVSCLLQHADPRKILAKLREDYPQVVHRASCG